MPEPSTSVETFSEWAIVDVMGHQRYIGQVTEQVIAGHGFVRVDVPENDQQKSWTKLLGPDAIYSITPVSEGIARGMAAKAQKAPVSSYELPKDFKPRIAATASSSLDDDPFIDDDEDDECF
ncbi:MAG: acetyltransferase [Planctomycetota bacterium]